MGTNHNTHLRTWLIVAALAAGCAPVNSQVENPSALTSDSLAISASSTSIGYNSSLTITASGGTPPYSFSLASGGTTSDEGSVAQTSNTTATFTSLTVSASDTQISVTDSTGYSVSTPDITISSTGSSGATGLTVIVGTGGTSSTTITTSQTATIVVSGGSGNYTYSVQGPGTVSGQTFLPSGEGTATITVNDTIDTTLSGTCTVIITDDGSSSDGLNVSPASPSTEAGQGVQITPGGGTGPYLFGVVSGGGTFSITSVSQGDSTTYYPPGGAEAGSQLELSVEDQSDGNVIDFWVTITSGGGVASTSPISWSSSSFVIDNDFAITFDNTGDVAGYTGNPVFWIWGSGPSDNGAEVGWNGGTLDAIVLTNYTDAAGAPTAYEGTFTVQGRSASTTITYCIPPSTNGNSLVAYISQSGGPNGHFNNPIASYGGNVANGQELYAYFVTVDGSPFNGAGNASVSFTGQFTSYSDCSNFNQNEFVEVVN